MSSRALLKKEHIYGYGIGNTPLGEVKGLDTGVSQLFLKDESKNPFGSIKDRVAAAMIELAQLEGNIWTGGPKIIEATSGNTGLALAHVAKLNGFNLVIFGITKMPPSSVDKCKELGAIVHLCDASLSANDPNSYHNRAVSYASETGGFLIDQFENPANPLTHQLTTGPEIWEKMGHKVDAVVCGIGTSGTMTGLARYFRSVSPTTEMVLADPIGSVTAPYIHTGSEKTVAASSVVVGVGQNYVVTHLKNLHPETQGRAGIQHAYIIPDALSIQTCNDLHQLGISAGSSAGMIVAAALEHCRAQTTPKRVVAIIPDNRDKYKDFLDPRPAG